jgi:hypothetical protein
MTDDELLLAFERCTLPAAAWTHEAHVLMAWTYLSRHDEAEALRRARAGIQCFNATVIKKDAAYHETITAAFVRLIADRRASLPRGHTFGQFKEAAPELLDRTMTALLRHYRRETLFSDAARQGWVEPDLVALPVAKLL